MSVQESSGIWASRYQAIGWKLVPIPFGKKGPTHDNWGALENCGVAPTWDNNIGLVHAHSGTCAIDIDNVEEARVLLREHGIDLDALLNAPDAVQIVSGRPNRAKLLYALPFECESVKWVQRGADGKNHDVLNFRCAASGGSAQVQDVLPPSIHPDTRRPYTWGGAGSWAALPGLPEALGKIWQKELDENRCRVASTAARYAQRGVPHPLGDEFGVLPGPALEGDDLALLLSALDAIDPDCDRNTWVAIGAAMHCVGASYEAFDIWSARGTKYAGPEDTLTRWNSYHDDRAGGVTAGTVFHLALEAGWRFPRPTAEQMWTPEVLRALGPAPAIPQAVQAQQEAAVSLREDILQRISVVTHGTSADDVAAICVLIAQLNHLSLNDDELVNSLADRSAFTKAEIKAQLKELRRAFRHTGIRRDTAPQPPERDDLTPKTELDKLFVPPEGYGGVVRDIQGRLLMDGGTPDRDPLPRLLSCNMETILRNGCGTLYPLIRFNEFTRQPEFHSHDGGALEATDAMYSKLQSVVSRDFQVEFKETILFAQADVVAHTNSYHPVQDYLRSIQWDGEERVETWLTTYLGVEDTPYSRAVAGIILCGAVQRIMRPGSKFDYMLILEGGQGLNKSKAVAALVPRHSWFTDVGLDMRDKEATAQNIQGKWIIEVGELKGMRESTAEQIKQFITRRDDRFRPPYGRAARDWPRQCIFIGTTNQRHYLFDSANRRHLPVRCTKVDDEGIAAMRDQLWAEAVVKMENAKSAFHLYPVIEVIARDEQEDRRVVDPWEEALETFLSDRNKVHTRELLCALGYTDVGTQDQALWSRLTRVMQTFANDWDYSTRTSSDHANFTGRHRGYRRKTPLTAVTGNVFTFDPGHGNRKAPLVDAGGQPINEKKE